MLRPAIMTLLAAALLGPFAVADDDSPQREVGSFARASRAVVDHLARSGIFIDDSFSEETLDRLLKRLDPERIYFTAEDVRELWASRFDLDDALRAGDLSIPLAMQKRLTQRVRERHADAELITAGEHDFTIDEYALLERTDAPYARSQKETQDLWRRRVKAQLVRRLDAGADLEEAREQVLAALARAASATERSTERIGELFLAAAVGIDRYSTYLSPASARDLAIDLRLELVGIGAVLEPSPQGAVVKSIVNGGSAARDGRLRAGDVIVAVGSNGDPAIAAVGASLESIVRLIRGPKGTQVTLTVRRAAQEQPLTITLPRARIVLDSMRVSSQPIDVPAPDGDGSVRVGVITVPSFYGSPQGSDEDRGAAADLARRLEELKSSGAAALVVDVRDNSGGLLSEAVAATGLFIDSGPVVQIERAGEVSVENDPSDGRAWNSPVVVLTSSRTASAAEIFAGALQDYGRAVIVGDPRTYGKGSVQSILPLLDSDGDESESLGSIKWTTARFYRPSGQCTGATGVRPDIVFANLTAALPVASELQRAAEVDPIAASELQREPHQLSADTLARLATRSEERRAANRELRLLDQAIARRLLMGNRRLISLKAKQRELASLRKSPKLFEQSSVVRTPALERVATGTPSLRQDSSPTESAVRSTGSAYLDEVLAIAVDLATQ